MAKKKKQPEKKYRITLTEHQLRLMANCVEDCHRFMAGQMELSHSTCMVDAMRELHEKLRDLKHLVTPHLSYNASYDWCGSHCPNEYQRKFIAETYYLYREIIHQLTLERNIDSVYNSPTLTCEDSGEPITIERVS